MSPHEPDFRSAETFRILAVCVGNVCRSPLTERLFRLRADQLGLDFEVSSAGVRGLDGHPMDPLAAQELAALGGTSDGFVARRLTPSMVESSTLILTATRPVKSALLAESPRALRRTFTLLEFAALVGEAKPGVSGGWHSLVAEATESRLSLPPGDYDIADPIGHGPTTHKAVAEQIDVATRCIVAALVASAPGH